MLLSSKTLTVWATVWTGQKMIEETLLISLIDELSVDKIKLIKIKINCHLDISAYLKMSYHTNIDAHLNITEDLEIFRCILENIKLKRGDRH